MIYVTVGNHTAPFDRLIRWMDEIAPQLADEVVWQTGVSSYIPCHGRSFKFCTSSEQISWIERARAVVTHAGVGSIIDIARASRPAVVVPRLSSCHEHLNDHQVELASALSERGLVTYVQDQQALLTALQTPILPVAKLGLPNDLIKALQQTIAQFKL